MRVREAKDILVQQITREASIEGIPLSDFGKRMMYFTEGRTAVEDPIQLNEEFEAQYDNATYEKKVAQLMKHAYKRLKTADSPDKETWDRSLKRGDHYILVMWGESSSLSTLMGFGLAVLILALVSGIRWIGHSVRPPNPQLLTALFVAFIVFCIFSPRQLSKAFGWVIKHTVDRFLDPNGEKEGET